MLFVKYLQDIKNYCTVVLVCYDRCKHLQEHHKDWSHWLENVFWEEFSEDQNPFWFFSKEMGNVSWQVQIPETEGESNNIMEHNTDRRGDLEVEDDGPY